VENLIQKEMLADPVLVIDDKEVLQPAWLRTNNWSGKSVEYDEDDYDKVVEEYEKDLEVNENKPASTSSSQLRKMK